MQLFCNPQPFEDEIQANGGRMIPIVREEGDPASPAPGAIEVECDSHTGSVHLVFTPYQAAVAVSKLSAALASAITPG